MQRVVQPLEQLAQRLNHLSHPVVIHARRSRVARAVAGAEIATLQT